MLYEKEPVNASESLDTPAEAKALAARFMRTESSTLCDMYAPVFTGFSQQKRLLEGVDIRPVLRQNTENIRLLAASTVKENHDVQLSHLGHYIGRAQVAQVVLVGIERRLQSSPATYLLRDLEIKTRTDSPGVSHNVLHDIYPHRLPSKHEIAYVKTEAFQESRRHDPFQVEHFHLKTAFLDVGGSQQT